MAPDFIIINADIIYRKWNSYKKFQSIPKFTIFEILKLFEYSFLFHIPSLLIRSTLTKTRLSEFHRKNIGDQKSCEKKLAAKLF